MKKIKKPIPIDLLDEFEGFSNSTVALFFVQDNTVKIPAKSYRFLQRHTPGELLTDIHPDKAVAIEMCLFFLNALADTYYVSISESTTDTEKLNGWKRLTAEYLNEMFDYQYKTRTAVLRALEYKGRNGSIVECNHKYSYGSYSFGYRLGKNYFGNGIVKHKVKTTLVKTKVENYYRESLIRALQNPICKNLIRAYKGITLPTLKEVQERAKKLISENFITNKGRRLKSLNRHTKEYYKKTEGITWAEDSIEIFKYLTEDGYMIPKAGDEKSGGRVYDTFTLMPSWIRDMVKMDDQPIHKIDFSALHPNICANLYGGVTQYITHAKIAEEAGIPIKDVKTEHLSFFNKTWEQMTNSPLFNYYWQKEPKMMDNIRWDKYDNELEQGEKHKNTSRKMFKKEVEIMTECIKRLNESEIYVGYIYDALFCSGNYSGVVKQVMDEVSLDFGVKTIAKIDIPKKLKESEQELRFKELRQMETDGLL